MSLKYAERKFHGSVADRLEADDCTIEEKVEVMRESGLDRIPLLMMERHNLDYDTACRMCAECMMIRGHYFAKRLRQELSKEEYIRIGDMVDSIIIAQYSRKPTVPTIH
ncbi:hypothetical protein HZB90_02855 [archaeon]|nr:hypothetical protein [archaeon]